VFSGEQSITLDAKGRIAIPTRYREEIAAACDEELMLTYSPFESGCLWLYPDREWVRVRDEVLALSSMNPGHRGLKRRLVGSAVPVEPDGHGRLQLPQTQRQFAGLEKNAVFMGIGPRFEIWNEQALQQQRAEEERLIREQQSAEMAELRL